MATSAKVVDFSNVKDASQFNTTRRPAGDYLATVTMVVDGESSKDQTFQYIFTIKLKKYATSALPYYCKLQENQLWKLRNLLIAAGMTVPKKRMKLDPSKTVGKTIGVTIEDDEYEGKEKSVIAAVFPAAELVDGAVVEDDEAETEEEEEELEDDVEEEAEEEADATDAFDAMDRTELKQYLKTDDPAFTAKKSQTDDDLRELARAIDAGDEDDEDEDEEEEAPAPVKKAPARKVAAKKAPAKKAKAAVSDEELEELDIDDL